MGESLGRRAGSAQDQQRTQDEAAGNGPKRWKVRTQRFVSGWVAAFVARNQTLLKNHWDATR